MNNEPTLEQKQVVVVAKSKGIAILLCLFLGGIGAHKFYLGDSKKGIFYLLFCWTLIPGIIALVELFKMAFMSEEVFNAKYNNSNTQNGHLHLKKCKQCGCDISTNVKICPFCYCKNKKLGKGSYIGIASGVLLLLIIIIASISNNDIPTTTVSVMQNTPKPTETILTVSAVKLAQEYEDNEVGADQKYRGKLVEITGTVKTIGKDIINSPYITLSSGKDFAMTEIQCYFKNEDEINKIATLQPDDRVTVQGIVDGVSLFNVVVKRCVLK